MGDFVQLGGGSGTGSEATSGGNENMSDDAQYVEIEVMLHRETKQAVLASDCGDAKLAVWVPKSEIVYRDVISSRVEGEVCIIQIPLWLAQ